MRTGILVTLLGALVCASRPALASDPPGIGDCLMAAEASLKLRSEHKLKLTRTQLLVCSSPSCPVEVRQECMKRIDEVNMASPSIVLTAKTAGGKELVAVKVTVDGQALTDHLDGSALAIDPGAHEFTFEATGLPVLTQTIILHEGEKDRRETVVLGGPADGAAAHEGPAESVGAEPRAEAPSSEGSGSGRRLIGLVTGGTGVAGLAVGGILGALASSAWSKAQSECPSHAGCSSQAMSDRSSALSLATGSTVGFVAGGVLLAAGATLFFTAPSSGSSGVSLRVAPGGLTVTGGF